MTKEEKNSMIGELTDKLNNNSVFYLADTSALTVEQSNLLRRKCFESNVELRVVKNTLLKKAMEKMESDSYSPMMELLKGTTAIMFSEVGNAPAKIIKDFRKKNDMPLLKGAYIETACYVGDDQLTTLAEIKSKEELIGEIVGLLQSPAKNVISALKSSGGTIAGIVKTLSEK